MYELVEAEEFKSATTPQISTLLSLKPKYIKSYEQIKKLNHHPKSFFLSNSPASLSATDCSFLPTGLNKCSRIIQ